jgi:hypothetical protein
MTATSIQSFRRVDVMPALHNLRDNNDDGANQSESPLSLQQQSAPSSRYTRLRMSLAARRAAVVALLACGGALWFAIGNGRGVGAMRWILLAASVGIGALPPVSKRVAALRDRIRHPSRRTAERTALLVGILATTYFVFTAFHQDRDLFPKTHDESSYLLGMQMLAHGRLWMPKHPLADFFETFYVIVDPVYASKYFPGTALMYAPTIWLHWPTWVLPVVASGAIVGLLYRLITDLVDGAAGLLTAMLMASLSWFRMLSILLFSQVPMLLLGLLLFWAWLRWREKQRAGWLIAIGAFAGWAAITRPVDALVFAAVVGIGIGCTLRRQASRKWLVAAAWVILGAAPFLTIQLVFDKGVTGHFLQTPFTYYIDRDHPQTSFGFHEFDPERVPVSSLPQKRDYYRNVIQPLVQRHRIGNLLHNWVRRDAPGQPSYDRPRLPMVVDSTMPFRVLLPIAFVGLLGLTDVRRRVLWLTLPLFIVAYVPYTFFLEHYAVSVAPAVILSVVLGGEVVAATWPRFGCAIRSSFALGIVTLALLSTYELNPVSTLLDKDKGPLDPHLVDDETFHSSFLRAINTQIPDAIQKPAVILFRYAPGQNVIEEPVYNNAAAWPDDQEIVRAHDLGERDVEIVRYYAERQPDRMFYRFDRATMTLSPPLGTAKQLYAEMRRPPTTATTR